MDISNNSDSDYDCDNDCGHECASDEYDREHKVMIVIVTLLTQLHHFCPKSANCTG